jgi:hypothetical protein
MRSSANWEMCSGLYQRPCPQFLCERVRAGSGNVQTVGTSIRVFVRRSVPGIQIASHTDTQIRLSVRAKLA